MSDVEIEAYMYVPGTTYQMARKVMGASTHPYSQKETAAMSVLLDLAEIWAEFAKHHPDAAFQFAEEHNARQVTKELTK